MRVSRRLPSDRLMSAINSMTYKGVNLHLILIRHLYLTLIHPNDQAIFH